MMNKVVIAASVVSISAALIVRNQSRVRTEIHARTPLSVQVDYLIHPLPTCSIKSILHAFC